MSRALHIRCCQHFVFHMFVSPPYPPEESRPVLCRTQEECFELVRTCSEMRDVA